MVTKGLREIGEQRLKYPTLSVKETMLKLFAIFLKTENPANTPHMKEKYMKKMQCFLEKCTVPEELHDLADEKRKSYLSILPKLPTMGKALVILDIVLSLYLIMRVLLRLVTNHDLMYGIVEKKKKAKWPKFKEDYYNRLGTQYDKILRDVEKEKQEGFWNYMK